MKESKIIAVICRDLNDFQAFIHYLNIKIYSSDIKSGIYKEKIFKPIYTLHALRGLSIDGVIITLLAEENPLYKKIQEEVRTHMKISEKTSSKLDQFDFGKAIEYMKGGHTVRRKGWNGKGMYIFINFPPQGATFNEKEILPHIVVRTADRKILNGWLASQTDILAEDWELVLGKVVK